MKRLAGPKVLWLRMGNMALPAPSAFPYTRFIFIREARTGND